METISITIGASLVFIYFLQLMNANFLKERTAILEDRIFDARRYHNAWHKWKLFLMGSFILLVAILIYTITQDTGISILSFFLSAFFIWSVGDVILNKLMKWNLLELGNKSGLDYVPFWLRFVLLVAAIIVLAISCNTSYGQNFSTSGVAIQKPYFQDSIKVLKSGIFEESIKLGTELDSLGVLRWNSTLDSLEFWDGIRWGVIGGSGAGITGLTDPLTTRGDLIYKNPSNITTRLPIGTVDQVLTSDGTDVTWKDASTSMVYPTSGIALSNGSTWSASIENNSANWNTSYGWGDHGSRGYLTSEVDGSLSNEIQVLGIDYDSITLTSGGGKVDISAIKTVRANTAKVTNATHSGDVAGSTTLTIQSDAIEESMLKIVNPPTDEYYLSYESTTGDFEWQEVLGGGSSLPDSTGYTYKYLQVGAADYEWTTPAGAGDLVWADTTVSGQVGLATYWDLQYLLAESDEIEFRDIIFSYLNDTLDGDVHNWIRTGTAAHLLLAVDDHTGTSDLVFNDSPTIIDITLTGDFNGDGVDDRTGTGDLVLATAPTFDGLVKKSVTAGITASNPGGQGDGQLTSNINEVSTVGTVYDAVTLPSAAEGIEIFIINNGANTLEIFPASGDDLGQGVNTATTLSSGSNITFVAYNTVNWEVK